MINVIQEYRRTHIDTPKNLHKGLDAVVHEFVGKFLRRQKIIHDIYQQALEIRNKAEDFCNSTDKSLQKQLSEVRCLFRKKNETAILSTAMAAMVEAANRTLGLKPFVTQIMGGIALNSGYLAEMATGEGKTLVACLPAALAAWTGKPCHIVTVNDYLSDRDATEMEPFYSFCGLSVGTVTSRMSPKERKQNYDKDIVYTTSKELTADFLRDRLKLGHITHPSRRLIKKISTTEQRESVDLVMRGLDTAIIDEADSVLIDEAVTPLIISQPKENSPLKEACQAANKIANFLIHGVDYDIKPKFKEIIFNDSSIKKITSHSQLFNGIWKNEDRLSELLHQALTAREFYHNDKQYVIQDGKVVIIDEFTGRQMPNRSWRHGLHQAIEAKEGLELSNPSDTLARISFQKFFRLFRKLSGMTGTAKEAASEFWHIYELPVITIPTHKPCIRKIIPDSIFHNAEQKWEAIVNEIIQVNQSRRPVLIGTRSIKISEQLAASISQKGLNFNLLNAIRHKEEADIIKTAGKKDAITIATNMAGRGTDIKLGQGVAELGGLHVIATEKHESGRIDRQLFGRCARQGDPGSCHAFISMEDELVQRFCNSIILNQLESFLEKKQPSTDRIMKKLLSHAQKTAERLASRQRRNVLQMDNWLEVSLSFAGQGSIF